MTRKELFIELLLNSNYTAEEIYQKIIDFNDGDFKTTRILRSQTSWNNCIYEGSIGINDFIVSEASSSSLSDDNIAMNHDDYKETMLKFIREFKENWERNSERNIMQALVLFASNFAISSFSGAGRNEEIAREQRKHAAQIDAKNQLKTYNVSEQKGNDREAVCCERNSTIGNIFNFAGFETYQISGELDNGESHFFILVKHGESEGYFSLIDAFNGIMKPKILPGNYNLSQGFRIPVEDKRTNRTYTYKLFGPLIKITDEVLDTETEIRKANTLKEVALKANNIQNLNEIVVLYNSIKEKINLKLSDESLTKRFEEYIENQKKIIERKLNELSKNNEER